MAEPQERQGGASGRRSSPRRRSASAGTGTSTPSGRTSRGTSASGRPPSTTTSSPSSTASTRSWSTRSRTSVPGSRDHVREPDAARALAAVVEDWFALAEQDMLRNRVLVAEQGLLSRPSRSQREEEARQAARARIARPRVRVGELPRGGDARRRDPGDGPPLAHARGPGALQQHLELVPPRRDRRAPARRRLLHAADADHGGRGAERACERSERPHEHRRRRSTASSIARADAVTAAPVLLGAECRRCGTVTFPPRTPARAARRRTWPRRTLAAAGRCGPGRSSASGRSRRRMPATRRRSSSHMASAMSNSPVRSASRRA